MRLVRALEMTGTTSRDAWKPYWAAQQRFFKLLCISMKVSPLLGPVACVRDNAGWAGVTWHA